VVAAASFLCSSNTAHKTKYCGTDQPSKREGAMASEAGRRPSMHHDWHSVEYVADWIAHDVARDPERRPRLQQMLAAAPFARDAAIKVLDVGAGYGAVTEEVLKTFPQARVTLQDYSTPMLGEA